MSEKTVNKKGKKKHRINLFSRFVAFLARPLLWLVYPTKILGKERFPGGGGLCVCNHFTPMDANPILCRLIKKNRHVMIKGEMFKNRLVGDFLRAMGGIPVKRGEADLSAVKQVMSALKKGEKVVVFPEGTRNTEGVDLQPLKSGVALMALKSMIVSGVISKAEAMDWRVSPSCTTYSEGTIGLTSDSRTDSSATGSAGASSTTIAGSGSGSTPPPPMCHRSSEGCSR